MSDLTPENLINVITQFEREYRVSPDAHKAAELEGMDLVRLVRIRDLYAEAISLCMIERRR
jgi:hypothetical protein